MCHSMIDNTTACPRCHSYACNPSCPLRLATMQRSSLYEYLVLHEGAEGGAGGVERRREEMAGDLEACRQLYDLDEVRLLCHLEASTKLPASSG
jgi:hypothetical protein